jgi:hypothetical protein
MSLTLHLILALTRSICNIDDLVAYKGLVIVPDTLFNEPSHDPIDIYIPNPIAFKNHIDVILDDQIVSTKE